MCRDEMLAQLTELFGDYISQHRIVATIEKFNDLNVCIEALLKEQEEPTPSTDDEPSTDDDPSKSEPTDQAAVPNGPDPSTGATRKAIVGKGNPTEMPTSFASLLQKGNIPAQFGQAPAASPGNSGRPRGKQPSTDWPANLPNILDMCAQGYRVMVLLRGAPGSGKSHLSRMLIDRTSNGDYRNHIFSTDDFFMVNGSYKFQPESLDLAHRFNQQNVLAKARDGWSPLVVDNTNIRLWEMAPYVKIAADHGYYLDVLEPVTHWRNNSRSLATRNTHGVPEPKIRSMLQNYEKLSSVQELYRVCNLEHTLYIPAKMRHYPILPEDILRQADPPPVSREPPAKPPRLLPKWGDEWESGERPKEDKQERAKTSGTGDLSTIPLPKPPREIRASDTPRKAPMENETELGAACGRYAPEEDFSWDFTEDWRTTDTNWKPYDTESGQFWSQTSASGQRSAPATEPQPQRAPNPNLEPIAEFLLSSVKQPTKLPETKGPEPVPKSPPLSAAQSGKASKKTDKKRIALTKHQRGCPNESAAFSEICNLYPKVPESYLWDLFEKCSGDGDWVANLLLEEQKLENFESSPEGDGRSGEEADAGMVDALAESTVKWNLLECSCNEPIPKGIPHGAPSPVGQPIEMNLEPDAGLSQRPVKRSQGQRESVQATKREIESRFILGNEHFSEPIRKLRLARGFVPEDESPPEEVDANEKDTTDSEVVEMRLGVELVQQLHELFKDKHCPKSLELDDLPADRTRVFMATETAEQLYLLFLDSMYSYNVEENQHMMREDARMAQLLNTEQKYPALFKPPDPSGVPNLKDIIEMEEALAAYRKETDASWKKASGQANLAQQLSQQKLKEMFPHVNGEDLVQVLTAHDHRFDETVQVLNASIPDEFRQQMLEKEQLLKRGASNEEQKLLDLFSSPTPSSSSLSGEEAINFHLITAEECRNLAQHHRDLKNECHEKARLAIQRSVPGLADYYSQIARLHRTKIDLYDSRASNCIMEVHKLKLNNADVLDLHYLHSQEALRCLELFLAEHAAKLLSSQQRFKTLYIITGRGLHSADGKPIIKQRVKAMLRVKNIRYTELNPGFLKIKLFNRDELEHLMLTS